MVRKFLLLFPAFRALEQEAKALREDHARLTTDVLLLQDRLDAARDERCKLWEMTQECLRGERSAYQMHVNQSWQRQGAGVPYPDAPHLPPSAVPKQVSAGEAAGRKGRMLPSEAVARRTEEFLTSLVSQG
jgi:hypothetical protein